MEKKFDKYLKKLDLPQILEEVENGIQECIENIIENKKHEIIYAFSLTVDIGNGYISFYLSADEILVDKNLKILEKVSNSEQLIEYLDNHGWEHIDDHYAPNFQEKFYNQLKFGERIIDVVMEVFDKEDSEESDRFDEYIVDELTSKLVKMYEAGAFKVLPLADKFGVLLYRNGYIDNRFLDRMKKHGHNLGFAL